MVDWVQLTVSFVLGVCAGQLLRFERIPRGKRAILRPRIEWPSLESRWITLMLVSLFLVSTAQITWWTLHQRQCNEQLQAVTVQLRRIGNEDRELESQDDKLKDQRDDAMTAMTTGLIADPVPPAVRVDGRALLNRYTETIKEIDLQRDRLHEQRAELERQRKQHALPTRKC